MKPKSSGKSLHDAKAAVELEINTAELKKKDFKSIQLTNMDVFIIA